MSSNAFGHSESIGKADSGRDSDKIWSVEIQNR